MLLCNSGVDTGDDWRSSELDLVKFPGCDRADDIYKINLLEAMLIAKEAWDAVSPETIGNCWKHADIQQ